MARFIVNSVNSESPSSVKVEITIDQIPPDRVQLVPPAFAMIQNALSDNIFDFFEGMMVAAALNRIFRR